MGDSGRMIPMTRRPSGSHNLESSPPSAFHLPQHVHSTSTSSSPTSLQSPSSASLNDVIPPSILLPPTPPHPYSTYSSYLASWDPNQIASFLAIHKCAHYAEKFQENDITGDVILELGESELKELGVMKIGERVKLMSGIKALRRRCAGGVGAGAGLVPPTPGAGGNGTPTMSEYGRSPLMRTSPVVVGLYPSSSSASLSRSFTAASASAAAATARQNAQYHHNHHGQTKGSGGGQYQTPTLTLETKGLAKPQLKLNDDTLSLSSVDRVGDQSRQRERDAAPQRDKSIGGIATQLGAVVPTLSRSSSLSGNAGSSRRGSESDRSREREREQERRPSTSSAALERSEVAGGVVTAGSGSSGRRLNASRPPPLHLSSTSMPSVVGGDSNEGGSVNGSRSGSSRREREREGRVEIGSRVGEQRERKNAILGQAPSRTESVSNVPASAAARYAFANGNNTQPGTPVLATPRGPIPQPLASALSTDSNGSSGSGSSPIEYLSSTSSLVIGHPSPGSGSIVSAKSSLSSFSNSSGTSSTLTITPGMTSSSNPSSGSVPGPMSSSTLSLGSNLRAMTISAGRRSPSPAIATPGPGDASAFAGRPLPGVPSTSPGSAPQDSYPAVTRGFGERRANLVAARAQQGGGRPSTSGEKSLSHKRSGSLGDSTEFGKMIKTSSGYRPHRPSTSSGMTTPANDKERHPYANPDGRSTARRVDFSPRSQDDTSPRKDRFGSGSTATPTAADTFLGPPPRASRNGGEHTRAQSAAQMSLEDVRRKCVKFILADDGSSRVVNLESCEGGMEVMEKALKKFGKWKGIAAGTGSESEGEVDETTSLKVDGWGVFMSESDDEDRVQPLTEAELLAICHAPPDDPSRQNGLYLKRLRRLANRKDIKEFFGEAPPMTPTSPNYLPMSASASKLGFPSPTGDRHQARPQTSIASRNVHRASVVSVMSGLGVPLSEVKAQLAMQELPPVPTPSTGNFLANKGKKMYNFFGHRPPSELISSHLADYFPAARRRDLEKGARNSMLRIGDGKSIHSQSESDHSNSNRASYGSGSVRDSLDVSGNRLPSRFSVASSSASSGRLSRSSASFKALSSSPSVTIPEDHEQEVESVPKVSVSTTAGEVVSPSSAVSAKPPFLPPLEAAGESLSDSLKVYAHDDIPPAKPRISSYNSAKNRLSTASVMRRRRQSNASMLTVDEITAQVDHRRASVISFGGSDDDDTEEELAGDLGPAYDPGLAPQGEDEEELEEDEDEDEEYESESEEEDEEDEQPEVNKAQGQKFTSAGANRSIKWSKGALVGAGSFGQVYLGLDLQKGLLMAVKQVDIRGGVNTANEGRKKEMVTAMQREIELLKELHHENIVQYLDSSTDENFLNIFLEYVPGGSVTALLNNYGAFEEALVRTFVRQILTGLQYLHDKGIIHRDIKGANILVDNKGGVKISDFGISKKVENNLLSNMRLNRPSLQGSVFWMAPEVVKQKTTTKKADIWSVGCLIVEMLTGEHPYPQLSQMQAIFKIGSAYPTPELPSNITPEAADLLERTFEIDYVKRPLANELLAHPFLTTVL